MIDPKVSATKEFEGEPTWEIATLFPNQGQWTVEKYLALETNRLIEFTHGRLEFLPAPTVLHQIIAGFLYRALWKYVNARNLGLVLFMGLRVRIEDEKIREPDLAFMFKEQTAQQEDRYWRGADLVMEVVSGSKEDRECDLIQKREEYAQAGIAEYWIVDPARRQITVLALEGEEYAVHGEFGEGEQATSRLLEGFAVDVLAVFTATD